MPGAALDAENAREEHKGATSCPCGADILVGGVCGGGGGGGINSNITKQNVF